MRVFAFTYICFTHSFTGDSGFFESPKSPCYVGSCAIVHFRGNVPVANLIIVDEQITQSCLLSGEVFGAPLVCARTTHHQQLRLLPSACFEFHRFPAQFIPWRFECRASTFRTAPSNGRLTSHLAFKCAFAMGRVVFSKF